MPFAISGTFVLIIGKSLPSLGDYPFSLAAFRVISKRLIGFILRVRAVLSE